MNNYNLNNVKNVFVVGEINPEQKTEENLFFVFIYSLIKFE